MQKPNNCCKNCAFFIPYKKVAEGLCIRHRYSCQKEDFEDINCSSANQMMCKCTDVCFILREGQLKVAAKKEVIFNGNTT